MFWNTWYFCPQRVPTFGMACLTQIHCLPLEHFAEACQVTSAPFPCSTKRDWTWNHLPSVGKVGAPLGWIRRGRKTSLSDLMTGPSRLYLDCHRLTVNPASVSACFVFPFVACPSVGNTGSNSVRAAAAEAAVECREPWGYPLLGSLDRKEERNSSSIFLLQAHMNKNSTATFSEFS